MDHTNKYVSNAFIIIVIGLVWDKGEEKIIKKGNYAFPLKFLQGKTKITNMSAISLKNVTISELF